MTGCFFHPGETIQGKQITNMHMSVYIFIIFILFIHIYIIIIITIFFMVMMMMIMMMMIIIIIYLIVLHSSDSEGLCMVEQFLDSTAVLHEALAFVQ